MANWSNPTLTSTYVNFVTEVKGRDDDAARQFDPAHTSATNVPTNTIRYNGSATRWERWNGTAWNALASAYAIDISGNAGTVTNGVYTTGNQTIGGNKTFSGALTYNSTLTGGTGIINIGSGQFYKDASGNVGIGTSSPGRKVHIDGGTLNNTYARFTNTNGGNVAEVGLFQSGETGGHLVNSISGSTGFILWNTNGTERMRITSVGNVGIGTTNPTVALEVGNRTFGSQNSNYKLIINRGITGQYAEFSDEGGSATINGVNGNGGSIRFLGDGTERMRIDTAGNVLVGTTATPTGSTGGSGFLASSNSRSILRLASTSTATNELIQFFNPNGQVGNISTSASSTAYTTSSDYRLKHDIQPMNGALAKVAALKPCTYKWNADDSDGEGFIAHELAEVCPDAVRGEKDAVEIQQVEVSPAIPATYDEEGNELTPAVEAVYEEREVPVYQGIDTSFLIATLTAAIQELNAKVEAQAAEIAALKSA